MQQFLFFGLQVEDFAVEFQFGMQSLDDIVGASEAVGFIGE